MKLFEKNILPHNLPLNILVAAEKQYLKLKDNLSKALIMKI